VKAVALQAAGSLHLVVQKILLTHMGTDRLPSKYVPAIKICAIVCDGMLACSSFQEISLICWEMLIRKRMCMSILLM
jgi:hypothetical protein